MLQWPHCIFEAFYIILDLRTHRDIRRLPEQGFYKVRGEEEGEWCLADGIALAMLAPWCGQEGGLQRN